ncbi:MAG: hypothetical protein LBN98_00300 [Prevotellaceae bacterium]|jgi:hypothetical protein|nr:hypothetical protein [Prevotellaceae bacterium]
MKRFIFLLSVLWLAVQGSAHAQIYLKGFTGYSWAAGIAKLTSTQSLAYLIKDYQEIIIMSSHKMKYGQGLLLGISAGYSLTKNIAFELTGNTQLFSSFSYYSPSMLKIPPDAINYSYSGYGTFGHVEYSSHIFQFSPQVVFSSNPCGRFTFYLKSGPNFLMAKVRQTTQTERYSSVFFYEPSRLTAIEGTGKINIGLHTAFGTAYMLSKRISIFAEITWVNIYYTVKEKKYLRCEEDGIDAMHTLEGYNIYIDEKINFSHVGLNIGLKYVFQE